MYLINRVLQQTKKIFVLSLLGLLLNSCSEGDPNALFESLVVEVNDVQTIEILAVNTTITTGESLQLTLEATDSLGAKTDLTDSVTWTSSDDSIASVDSAGFLQSFTTDDTVTITASLSGFTDTIDITLSSASLDSIEVVTNTVVPEALSTSVCRQLGLKALGTYDDLTERDITSSVSWSSNTTSAIIQTDNGVSVSNYLAATIGVTATLDTVSSPLTNITIDNNIDSMALTPLSDSLAAGDTLNFQVLATYGSDTNVDISSTVNWDSSNTGVAAFESNNETLTAKVSGNTTVTASCGLLTPLTSEIAVTGVALDRIVIEPNNDDRYLQLTPGQTYQLSATAHYTDGSSDTDVLDQISWSVSNQNGVIVTVSNASPDYGLLTASSTLTGLDRVIGTLSGQEDDLIIDVK